jgi:predicted transcriptional regulator
MISVRVSGRTRREVARLARASGRTESALVRKAIDRRRLPASVYRIAGRRRFRILP